MITRGEALAYLLGSTCSSCSAQLPGPGEPCSACGRIPDTTAPELAAELDGPLALAAVEAAKLRADAWQLHDAAVAMMGDADEALFVARLLVRRDQAQHALDEHHRAHKSLYGPRTAARKAEDKAAAELAAAAAEHADIARNEELARRMRHGVASEVEAAVRLDKATAVLARYKAALAEAAARRDAAEQAFDQSVARAAMLEEARDSAVAAVTTPGRIPRSPELISMGLLRLILRGELDEIEMVIAGEVGRMICAASGATDAIVAEARGDLLREQEAEKRVRPLHVRPLGNGEVAATPNPFAPGTPQPYHPAGAIPGR